MLRLYFKSFTLFWNFALVVFIIAINGLTWMTEKSVYSIFQVHSFHCECLNLYTTCRLKIYANHDCTAYASLLLKIGLFVSKSPLSTWCSMVWKCCHYEALKENIDICWRLFDKICNRGWFLSTKFHVYEKQAIRNYYILRKKLFMNQVFACLGIVIGMPFEYLLIQLFPHFLTTCGSVVHFVC